MRPAGGTVAAAAVGLTLGAQLLVLAVSSPGRGEPREAPPPTTVPRAGDEAGQGPALQGALPAAAPAPPGATFVAPPTPQHNETGPSFVVSASWYGGRPATCDGRRVPRDIRAWTAHRNLPCGTLVTIAGPRGSITVPVEDRGPGAWTGRDLDLSPPAFLAIAGTLAKGVVTVSYRVAA